jgi:hypothetical protein
VPADPLRFPPTTFVPGGSTLINIDLVEVTALAIFPVKEAVVIGRLLSVTFFVVVAVVIGRSLSVTFFAVVAVIVFGRSLSDIFTVLEDVFGNSLSVTFSVVFELLPFSSEEKNQL